MFDWFADPNAWIALATLTALEIVLGVDNIVFISILAGKLPAADQNKARQLGLAAAVISRLALLFSITWIMKLTQPVVTIFDKSLTGRDLILLVGGLFLIWKATKEIHHKMEGAAEEEGQAKSGSTLTGVVLQILLVDLVFSLDSVITAVGMVDDISIMVAAVLISVTIMIFAAKAISDFVNDHPTVKMLALSFLLLIGMTLLAEGWALHIPKGYIYFAMAFSLAVELLNLRVRKKSKPISAN
jgi:predicted tellurium resistance membrane protein TerC